MARVFSALVLTQRRQVVENYSAVVRTGEQIVLLNPTVFLLLLGQFGTEEENSVNYGGVLLEPLDNGARSQIPEDELCVVA